VTPDQDEEDDEAEHQCDETAPVVHVDQLPAVKRDFERLVLLELVYGKLHAEADVETV